MVPADRGAGGEPLDLPLPVAHQRGGAHHQRGPRRGRMRLAVQVEGDQGDGLAEPHVVGEAGPEPQRGHPGQPAQPALLVVAQGGRQPLRYGDGLGPVRIGDPRPQLLQRARGPHLDALAADVGGAGQRGAHRLHRGEGVVPPVACPAGLRGIDQHPLVAQPHQGPFRLRQHVQLLARQPPAAEAEPPAEGEQRVGGEEPRSRVVTARLTVPADHAPGGQLARQLPGPVHLDTGTGQRLLPLAQQLRDLLVGQLHRVRHPRRQQRRQRRPGPGGPAQRQQRVDPGARPEGPVVRPGTGPDLRRVGDSARVAEAVQLEHRAEGAHHLGAGLLAPGPGGRLDPQ